jgi:predicted nucleotidyltransferase
LRNNLSPRIRVKLEGVQMKSDRKVKILIKKIKKYLRERYGEKIKKVILYGSYVKGKATEESDIDVIVVVDDSLNSAKVRESLSDYLFDVLLEEEELISVLVINESLYENYKSPFLLNVKEEGLVI